MIPALTVMTASVGRSVRVFPWAAQPLKNPLDVAENAFSVGCSPRPKSEQFSRGLWELVKPGLHAWTPAWRGHANSASVHRASSTRKCAEK